MASQLTRRTFLQGLSSAFALASLAACGRSVGPRGDDTDIARQVIELFYSIYLPNLENYEVSHLADEWEAENPEYTMEFVAGSGDEGIDQWAESAQAAGTLPDLMKTLFWRSKKWGFWVDIDDYVEEPNPYIPEGEVGHVRWRDAFIAGFSPRDRFYGDRRYEIPLSISVTQVYCNLDILEASGVDFEAEIINPRWTFDGMLEISQRIVDAGQVPWSMTWSSPYWHYIHATTLSGFLMSTGKWSVLDTDNDGFISGVEFAQAIDRGDWTAYSEDVWAMHQMVEDWTPYWSEFILDIKTRVESRFRPGRFERNQAAFWWGIDNWYSLLEQDRLRLFEFAVARFPLCFDRMATIGKGGPTQYLGDVIGGIGATVTATRNGTLDPCVDFMRLLTSCDGQDRLSRESGEIPVVFCANGPPELEQLKPEVGETFPLTVPYFSYDIPYWEITSEWLFGPLTYDEAMTKLQSYMEERTRELFRNKPELRS